MKWLTILFGFFIIFIVVLADMGRLGFMGAVYDFPNGDKAGHFILFGILAFLLDLTFFHAFPHIDQKRIAVIVGLILALLTGLEEYSQRFFSTRSSSIFDLLATYLGLIFFSWLALKLKSKQSLPK
jgi:polysaccharide biosynthesis protein VpsQ